jgi:hypothetical protein
MIFINVAGFIVSVGVFIQGLVSGDPELASFMLILAAINGGAAVCNLSKPK